MRVEPEEVYARGVLGCRWIVAVEHVGLFPGRGLGWRNQGLARNLTPGTVQARERQVRAFSDPRCGTTKPGNATIFKVAYSYGTRRNETRMLEVTDFARNPHGPEFGDHAVGGL